MSSYQERQVFEKRWEAEFGFLTGPPWSQGPTYKLMLGMATSESNLRALHDHPDFPTNMRLLRPDFERLVEFWKSVFPHRAFSKGNLRGKGALTQDLWLLTSVIPSGGTGRLRGYYENKLRERATCYHRESYSFPPLFSKPSSLPVRLDQRNYISCRVDRLVTRIFGQDFGLYCMNVEATGELLVGLEINGDFLDEPLTYRILSEFPPYEASSLGWNVDEGNKLFFGFRVSKKRIVLEDPRRVCGGFKVQAYDPQPGFEKKLIKELIQMGIPIEGVMQGPGPCEKEPHLVVPDDMFELPPGL